MSLSTSERLSCTLVERRRPAAQSVTQPKRQAKPVRERMAWALSPRRIALIVLVALPMLLAAAIVLGFA